MEKRYFIREGGSGKYYSVPNNRWMHIGSVRGFDDRSEAETWATKLLAETLCYPLEIVEMYVKT